MHHQQAEAQLEQFLSDNHGKPVIVVQGLGFVGAVMSLVCANSLVKEYAVVGVDLPTESGLDRINKINTGTFPIVSSDPKIQEYYESSRAKGNFHATSSELAYAKADVIIVDINLDVDKRFDVVGAGFESYDVDMTPFEKALETIGRNCKEDVLVLVETTVPPGTCANYVQPIIERELQKRDLSADSVFIGHSYERVMPGPNYIDSIQNFYRVYSGINEQSAEKVEAFLKTIIRTDEYPLTRLHNTTATEAAKVLENSFRAMNIAFMVEWSRFAENAGINLYEIVDAIRLRPTHANLMYPGIGVGGYCLTKDPLLASWSSQTQHENQLTLKQSEKAVSINDTMPRQAYGFLLREYGRSLEKASILFLGVSYRGNVGDTRYSPVEVLYKLCTQQGASTTLTDPYVDYWEEVDEQVKAQATAEDIKSNDIVIISTSHNEYRTDSILHSTLKETEGKFILDTVGLLSKDQIETLKTRHTIKVIGRGDL